MEAKVLELQWEQCNHGRLHLFIFMIIILDQYTPTEKFVEILTKSFSKQLAQKSLISNKITTTSGGEQLSWIKKYNNLFIHNWGYKEKIVY